MWCIVKISFVKKKKNCPDNLNYYTTDIIEIEWWKYIKEINSRAVSFVRYGAGILKWAKDELKVMDRKTRNIMTMNTMYHPQSDTDRLYIPRMESGRGFMSITNCVENQEQNLFLYAEAAIGGVP